MVGRHAFAFGTLTFQGRAAKLAYGCDTVDGSEILHHLGCPKYWFYTIKTFLRCIPSGADFFFPSTVFFLVTALRIIGSRNWWFGDPRTLLYRFKPLYRRVQWFLGWLISNFDMIAAWRSEPKGHPLAFAFARWWRDTWVQITHFVFANFFFEGVELNTKGGSCFTSQYVIIWLPGHSMWPNFIPDRWRSLNHPKKVTKNCQVHDQFFWITPSGPGWSFKMIFFHTSGRPNGSHLCYETVLVPLMFILCMNTWHIVFRFNK